MATRRSLLTAARSLIASNGIDGTSTRDIATSAGVNQALVYRYFGSRDNLISEALGSSDSSLLDAMATTDIGNLPRVLLTGILEATAAGVDARSSLATLATSAHNESIRPVIRAEIDALTGAIEARLSAPDAALRAELLVALGIGVAVMREKIGTAALATVDYEVLVDYIARMSLPVVSD